MADFVLNKNIEEVANRLPAQEFALGKGLTQPFRNTNSSSRCIMYGTEKEQVIQCLHSETPIVSTEYDNQFGYYSSPFVKTEGEQIVLGKISRYGSAHYPYKKYDVILLNEATHTIDVEERIEYHYIQESFGYMYDNTYMDSLKVGDVVPSGTVIKQSASYDHSTPANRKDAVNLTTVYLANGKTTEDPIVVSESAAKKLSAYTYSYVNVVINDNDILLNLYGKDDNEYKVMPDIGEEINEGILCAVRREKKDNSLYTQSWNNLKSIIPGDEKYLTRGKVVDIIIECNNIEQLENSIYNAQLKKYFYQQKEYCQNIVDLIEPLITSESEIKLSYAMSKLYYQCKQVVNNAQYINNDKVFNNINMYIMVVDIMPLRKGDKIVDRYGGKGVVSEVIPDQLMPKKMDYDGNWIPVDVQYNSSTCVNRLNPGQLFETSITFVGEQIIWHIKRDQNLRRDDAFKMIHKFISIVAPKQAEYVYNKYVYEFNDQDRLDYLLSIINSGNINIVTRPLSDQMSIDKIEELYDAFPFVKQLPVLVSVLDSNGNYRNIVAKRPLTVGKKAIYRLKQIAEEKFSVVSLAATNVKGENSKTKQSKQHKILFSSTPVKLGEMEWGDLLHIQATEQAIQVLMLLSTSPKARRLTQNLLSGDPFEINVQLDNQSTSRSAEIVSCYLKTIGLELVIEKHKRVKPQPYRAVVERVPNPLFKDIAQRNKYNFSLKDIDLVAKTINDLRSKFTKVGCVRTNGMKFENQEQVDQYITDMERANAIYAINEIIRKYKCSTIEEVCDRLLSEDFTSIKRPVYRVGATRIATGNKEK